MSELSPVLPAPRDDPDAAGVDEVKRYLRAFAARGYADGRVGAAYIDRVAKDLRKFASLMSDERSHSREDQ